MSEDKDISKAKKPKLRPKLNNAQQMFVECYLRHFNATRAAKEAGYSEKTAHSQGPRLLKNVGIANAIRTRMKEAAMETDEVLYHLAQIARGDLGDVLDKNGNVNIEAAREQGKTNLIKKVRSRAITTENSDISEAEAEAYDRLKALELIGRAHGIFTDRADITSGGKPLPSWGEWVAGVLGDNTEASPDNA